ncbi:MAG: hypothetical protein RBR86_10075 [Pseudobdellovibrionaceae bacterium]|jgi:hypothetical protein|nr:hypothetical protein [Pseudobdellovibrionaceae bacterium]
MTETSNNPALTPVDGKYIFQISQTTRIRFNADGWVEEIGKGGAEDPLGTRLQGKPNSKRDDIYARRYYDLYSRCLIVDIFPKLNNDLSGTGGLVLFKDLEVGSPMFERVNLIIEIANLHFGMGLLPLKG